MSQQDKTYCYLFGFREQRELSNNANLGSDYEKLRESLNLSHRDLVQLLADERHARFDDESE